MNWNFFSALKNIDLKMKLVKHMHFFDVLEKCNVLKGKDIHCGWNYPLFASLSMTSCEWEIAKCFQASKLRFIFLKQLSQKNLLMSLCYWKWDLTAHCSKANNGEARLVERKVGFILEISNQDRGVDCYPKAKSPWQSGARIFQGEF